MDLSNYATFHASRINLGLHLLAVPLFDLSLIAACYALGSGRWLLCVTAGLAMLAAMGAQKFGHGREQRAPQPFSGPGNFLYRWFREQFLIFPWFVLSGAWLRQWRRA